MPGKTSLPLLEEAWSSCTRCALGVHREERGMTQVFGEGTPGGILFVGEAPGAEEEKSGRPFIGHSGKILRKILRYFGLENFYITNAVMCRPCEEETLPDGSPRTFVNYKTRQIEKKYKDVEPAPDFIKTCKERLFRQIYEVDPLVVVALGGKAASALLGETFSILTDRGIERSFSIPGALLEPETTSKGTWVRRNKNVVRIPLQHFEVQYLCIPTLHPAYVARKHGDRGMDSATHMLVNDIRKAIGIYERYCLEVGHELQLFTHRDGADFSLEEDDHDYQ